MLIITLVLFLVIYALIYFFWLRASYRIVKKGPGAFMNGAPETAEPKEVQA